MTFQKLTESNTLYAPVFPKNWDESPLYPLADWINGMAFRDFNFSAKGKPVIKIAEIKNGITKQTKFTNSRYDETYHVKKGDMLFCWSGQPETSIDVFLWDGPEGWLNQHIFKVLPKIEEHRFFFYLLKYLNPNFIKIARNKQTTGLGHITKGDLERFTVKLPNSSEQRAIVDILSSFDDKIEILREQNKTLEATAQAIFKEWFAEPYKQGLSNELREIKLDEAVDIFIGRTPPRKEHHWFSASAKDWKWLSIKDMAKGGIYAIDTSEYLTQEAVGNFNIPIIDENTVVLSFKMTTGRVKVTAEKMLSNEAIAQFKFKPNAPFNKEYLYLYLKAFKFDALGSTSSIVTSINTAMIKSFIIKVPSAKLMAKFEKISEPLFEKVLLNQKQIITLGNLRNATLPRLMKGELRVAGFGDLP